MRQQANRLATSLVLKLPPDAAYRAAGPLSRALMGKKMKRLGRDMRLLFPDRSSGWIRATARDQIRTRAWAALDQLLLPRMSGDEVIARCTPEGLASARRIVDEVLAGGKGGVVYTLHYGRHMLSPFVLPLFGYPYVSIRSRTGMTDIERPMLERLGEIGVEYLDAEDMGSGVAALRTLKRNKLLFILIDGRVGQRPAEVEFFGRRVPMSLAFALLAQRTGAPLVAGVTYSEGPARFHMHSAKVELPDRDLEPEALGSLLLKPLEEMVRKDIGQWFGMNMLFRDMRTG
jgi:Kdo2-lipid IVA lauroyltransferase/acyltransferase